MIKLDKRLQAIISEIDGKKLADIGTDHGKVVVSALCMEKTQKVVAVDISEKSLTKAKKLATQYGLGDKISFIVGDGLLNIDEDVDCIVIAGMGGIEIAKILTQRQLNAKYILVPHQDSWLLREYLMDKKFSVKKDYIVEESNRFYDIIVVTRLGTDIYDSSELHLGKNKPSTEDFKIKLQKRKKNIEKITNGAGGYTNISKELQSEWEEIKKWDTQ